MMNQLVPTFSQESKLKALFEAFDLSQIEYSLESNQYEAASLIIDNQHIVYRQAKITPKKVGQFVAIWKRTIEGITAPHADSDAIDFLVINVSTNERNGLFVFPKSVLLRHGILSMDGKDGKRGMRVYPSWDEAKNNQAAKTQKWQLGYFYKTMTLGTLNT